MKIFTVTKNDASQRLDRFITKNCPELPAALMFKYIRIKRIKVNGKRAQINTKLSEGDTYLFFLAEDPDPKQDHCFPVNSIQGWIKVENDKLTVSDENGVAREYTDLSQLVADINKVK